jgi:hypothetical protein
MDPLKVCAEENSAPTGRLLAPNVWLWTVRIDSFFSKSAQVTAKPPLASPVMAGVKISVVLFGPVTIIGEPTATPLAS